MEEKVVGGITVMFTRGYSQWDLSGSTWHINWALGESKKGREIYHVTWEGIPKKHYFFSLNAGIIRDETSSNKSRKGTSYKFSALPSIVENYIRQNIGEL